MSVEYVPDLDADGNDLGGYTETVPDMPEREEPDFHAFTNTPPWKEDPEPLAAPSPHPYPEPLEPPF